MRSRMFLVVAIISTSMSVELLAQSKETSKPGDKSFPTTLAPVNPVKYYGPRKEKKKKKKSVTYDAQNNYYDRTEKIWKEREKREKTYERGEAKDYMKPPYFGHKKPPKIREIGKRKYCKICGMRH